MEKFFSSLGGFWTPVHDLESAKEAASLGGISAGYIGASYLVNVSFLANGISIFGEMPESGFEYNIYVIVYIFLTCLFAYFAYQTYLQKSFTFIPYIFVWFLLELFMSTSLSHPLIYLVMKFLFLVITINSIVGWLGIKKYKS